MARLILTQAGEDVDVGGTVTVVGTRSGGEVITIIRGSITLDASFNAGGDTIRLPGDASEFTVRLSGSQAIFESSIARVSVPIGSAGIEIAFGDVSRTLAVDLATGLVKLGLQTLTATLAAVEASGPLPTLMGTEAANTLNGTAGTDVIYGFGGNDTIDGLGGDDLIRGGLGDDRLLGSGGVDELYGDEGADRLLDNAGTHTFADGGSGNDWITVGNSLGTVQVLGGSGDDLIQVQSSPQGRSWINAGDGTDRVQVFVQDGSIFDVYLGTGRDELTVIRPPISQGASGLLIVYDFEVGATGDKVDLSRLLADFVSNLPAGANPFASGHFRLVDRSGDTVLQIDRDGASGGAEGFRDLIQFVGDNRATFTSENFGGYDPNASVGLIPPSIAYFDMV